MYFTSFREGLCVVKVFAIQDPSLPLKTYQDQLTDIKNRLATAPNVLPFHHSILTDKASLLMRQFIKDNLYDRIRQVFLNFWLWDPGWALTLCLFIVSILWIKVLQCGSKGKSLNHSLSLHGNETWTSSNWMGLFVLTERQHYSSIIMWIWKKIYHFLHVMLYL